MKLLFLIPLTAMMAMAQPNSEIIHYPAAELHEYSSTLKDVLTERNSNAASEWLSDLGNHKFEILRRDGDGAAELHQNWTDIFVVQSGEATILYGGTIEDERDEGNGEIRGTGLLNEKSLQVSGGDVFAVPPGLAHQTLVAPGKSFLTLIIKVEKK